MVYSREMNLNFENVIDWIERLEMATKVQNYITLKLNYLKSFIVI
jgi:hypothetical protein